MKSGGLYHTRQFSRKLVGLIPAHELAWEGLRIHDNKKDERELNVVVQSPVIGKLLRMQYLEWIAINSYLGLPLQ
jgi:hypothetical protein